MCGRYFIAEEDEELAEIGEKARKSLLADKVYRELGSPIHTVGEIRPTDVAPVIAVNRKGIRSIFPMRWGFTLPGRDTPIINARVETAAQKPTFKDEWARRRCIVPASWYFEWEHLVRNDGRKATGDKFMIQPNGSTHTYLCGLYRFEGNSSVPVFTILTREPGSDELKKIHDRMPLIMPRERIDAWIDPHADPSALLADAQTDMIMEKTL